MGFTIESKVETGLIIAEVEMWEFLVDCNLLFPCLFSGPRLDGAGCQNAENDSTKCVHSSSEKEYNLPRFA